MCFFQLEVLRRFGSSTAACAQGACITVDLSDTIALPETWHGIFYEDINHAGEGGLHVEVSSFYQLLVVCEAHG